MRIQRDRSSLRFGRHARRGQPLLFALWIIAIGSLLAIVLRFESVQSWVLSQVQGGTTPTPSAASLAEQGERAYLNGDLTGAIDWYGQAHALEPHHMGIAFEYGRMLIYQSYAGRSSAFLAGDALALAEGMVARTPDDGRTQALLCWALVEADRTQEAIGAGLRAIEAAPDFAEAHAYLSLAYLQDERPTFMLDAAQRAVTLNPDSVDARRALALALQTQGAVDAAIQQYEVALQLHPRLDALYFELAVSYKAQQNYAAAVAVYDRVLASNPDNAKAYTRLCETQYTLGKWTHAQEACEQAILLDPDYIDAYQQLGKIQYKRRNYEGAAQTLATCAELEAAQGIALAAREVECAYIRGLALVYLGECEEAWALLSGALTMNPEADQRRAILDGMARCTEYEDGFDLADIPTPEPPPTVSPDIIEVY